MSQLAHTFHIPVMGTAFTIDTPLKVAKYGISSVVSIGDDELCEVMREHYSKLNGISFIPIHKKDDTDYRAKRITAYLNLMHELVTKQFEELKASSFQEGSELYKYFSMLPENSRLKTRFNNMMKETDAVLKSSMQQDLRNDIVCGSIDVNIMTKLDRDNVDSDNNSLPHGFSDALAALRGFANSKLKSSIIFSAGFNRRLYAYCEEFSDFFPDALGQIKKKIVLKVSDFRSCLIQGKFLAKKGLWVSEYRIESGLNCGGHAFATEGYLLGPILEEFKQKKQAFFDDLRTVVNTALSKSSKFLLTSTSKALVTVQGGIGTYAEDRFLQDYFDVQFTGWGTPFLLVPEATLLDDDTRHLLINAKEKDTYTSGISPLGVPFNAIKNTASEIQKFDRAYNTKRPGSPCPKGYLISNTKYSKRPVCTASVFFQKREIAELDKHRDSLSQDDYDKKYLSIVDKACLCEDLAASALIENNIVSKRPLKTAICSGPNIAYFNKISSLKEIVSHIYGKINLLSNAESRPNMFVKELSLYLTHIEKEIQSVLLNPTEKQCKSLQLFRDNLFSGISYYQGLIPQMIKYAVDYTDQIKLDLDKLKNELETISEKYAKVLRPDEVFV